MKKIRQAIEINGKIIYMEVEENINIDESTLPSKNIPVGLPKLSKKTMEVASNILLAPAHVFANELLSQIEKMDTNPKKANLELYLGFSLESGKFISYVAHGKSDSSLKINLEWEIEKK